MQEHNQIIKEVLTANGIRFSFEDGSWGLIRASSNKPSLVIVTESPDRNAIEVRVVFYCMNIANPVTVLTTLQRIR